MEKTGRLIIAHEVRPSKQSIAITPCRGIPQAPQTNGFGAEISAKIQDDGWKQLQVTALLLLHSSVLRAEGCEDGVLM